MCTVHTIDFLNILFGAAKLWKNLVGMHAGNKKFSIWNKYVYVIINGIILPVYFIIHHVQWKYTDNNMKDSWKNAIKT
jgi:hypothetical protein